MLGNTGSRTCSRCGNVSPLSMATCPKCGLTLGSAAQAPTPPINMPNPQVYQPQQPTPVAVALPEPGIATTNEPRGWPVILEPHDLTEWVAAWIANWIWLSAGVIFVVLLTAIIVRLPYFALNQLLYLGLIDALISTFPLYHALKLRRLFLTSEIAMRHQMQERGLWLVPLMILSVTSIYLFFVPVGSIDPFAVQQPPIAQQQTYIPPPRYFNNDRPTQ